MPVSYRESYGASPLSCKADLRFVSLDDLMPLVRESLDYGQDVRFYPRGVSMLPMLRQGVDSVVISPVDGLLRRYDIPLYQRDDGSYVLHRIVNVRKDVDADVDRAGVSDGQGSVEYDCSGDHQFAIERGIKHDQVIAVVSGFYRGECYIPVTNLRYRAYCVALCSTRGLRHMRWRVIGRIKQWKRFVKQTK